MLSLPEIPMVFGLIKSNNVIDHINKIKPFFERDFIYNPPSTKESQTF